MKRKIITLDNSKCNGCGQCASDCPEGALRIIDGKARLVGDLLCDGLGACLSSCPEGAIFIEEREAEPYDERRVMENVVPQGQAVIQAHLEHLRSHLQTAYLRQALEYLQERGIPVDPATDPGPAQQASALSHWPVQMHLISPLAPHYRGSDLVVAADCVAYALEDFHSAHLRGRTLVIACPKLDSRQESYTEKLTALIDEAEIRSIRVLIMQVPCCGGLLRHVTEAARRAQRKVPIECLVVGIAGGILGEVPVDVSA